MTAPLKVDTGTLRRTGAAFAADAARLETLDPGSSLTNAAVAVPGLTTAGACVNADTTVRSAVSANAAATRNYGSAVVESAAAYDSTDQVAGRAIAGVMVAEPGR